MLTAGLFEISSLNLFAGVHRIGANWLSLVSA
jgi:hypothetical protein